MTLRMAAAGVLFALMSAAPAGAHHSIAAIYDASRSRTIEATVVEFQFINPHPLLVVSVTDPSGQSETWRLEMDNRFELVQIGVSRDTFKAGDRVIVIGSLARQQPRSLYIRRLDRASDGFRYEQVGASPKIGFQNRP
jgi:hypothetical protein